MPWIVVTHVDKGYTCFSIRRCAFILFLNSVSRAYRVHFCFPHSGALLAFRTVHKLVRASANAGEHHTHTVPMPIFEINSAAIIDISIGEEKRERGVKQTQRR